LSGLALNGDTQVQTHIMPHANMHTCTVENLHTFIQHQQLSWDKLKMWIYQHLFTCHVPFAFGGLQKEEWQNACGPQVVLYCFIC